MKGNLGKDADVFARMVDGRNAIFPVSGPEELGATDMDGELRISKRLNRLGFSRHGLIYIKMWDVQKRVQRRMLL